MNKFLKRKSDQNLTVMKVFAYRERYVKEGLFSSQGKNV